MIKKVFEQSNGMKLITFTNYFWHKSSSKSQKRLSYRERELRLVRTFSGTRP